MKRTTKGLILKEQNIGERDKLVTVLTADFGVMRAFVRGAKSVKSRKGSATTKLCYAKFSFYAGKDAYVIDEAQSIEMFFGLRDSIDKLALAEYFLELGLVFAPEEEDATEILRVLLNSLYMLANDKRPLPMLKALTELRLMTLSGYAPNLVACDRCGAFESDPMYFNLDGVLYCDKCADENALLALPLPLVSAMRHIVFAKLEILYNFKLDDALLEELSYITEQYLLHHTGYRFKTLQFYHSVEELG